MGHRGVAEDAKVEVVPRASSESRTLQVKADAMGSTSKEGMLSLMRHFLNMQREEEHLLEIWEL